MKVSLIIPVYNEAGHLRKFLEMVDAVELGVPKELVLVDDASTDASAEIAGQFAFQSQHQIFRQPFNQGKGAALRQGIQAATGDIIVVQDADFEYDVRDLKALIQPILEDRSDIVYGSRFHKSRTQVHRTFHYLVNRLLTLLSNAASGLYLSDMETCYKAFRASILKNIKLESNRFGFEPEITAKISSLRIRVEELPIRYFPRNYLEGKKISWRDGVAAVWHIFYFNFMTQPKDYLLPGIPREYVVKGSQWL